MKIVFICLSAILSIIVSLLLCACSPTHITGGDDQHQFKVYDFIEDELLKYNNGINIKLFRLPVVNLIYSMFDKVSIEEFYRDKRLHSANIKKMLQFIEKVIENPNDAILLQKSPLPVDWKPFLKYFKTQSVTVKSSVPEKITIWLFWENMPNKTRPVYLDCCIDTIKRHHEDASVVILTLKTAADYVKDKELFNRLCSRIEKIEHKADLVRVEVLYAQGGHLARCGHDRASKYENAVW
jgi:hypothetical protein